MSQIIAGPSGVGTAGYVELGGERMVSLQRILCLHVAVGAVSLLAQAAFAQQNGGSVGSPTSVTPLSGSSAGSRTGGAGTGSSMGTGTSTGSSATSSSSGTSGSGGTQSAGGSGTQQGPQFNAGDGSLGQQVMQGAFAGAQSGQFVGSQMAGGQASFQTSRGRGQTQPQFNAFSGSNFNNNFNRGQGQFGQRVLPRPQLTIGFTFSAPPASAVASNTAATLQNVQSLPAVQSRFSGVSVSVGTSGTVTLSGSVPDDHARQLAEILARLEPGVSDINNELSVTSGASYAPAASGP